jgi:hypothetical protein
MTAGYSGTPLAKKLGIKEGFTIFVVNAPDDYANLVAPLPENVWLIDPINGPTWPKDKIGDGLDLIHQQSQRALFRTLEKSQTHET